MRTIKLRRNDGKGMRRRREMEDVDVDVAFVTGHWSRFVLSRAHKLAKQEDKDVPRRETLLPTRTCPRL